jgi:hypothetical protein
MHLLVFYKDIYQNARSNHQNTLYVKSLSESLIEFLFEFTNGKNCVKIYRKMLRV